MRYAIYLLPEAEEVVFQAADWWAKNRSRQQAERWFNGIYEAIAKLESDANRYTFARENGLFPFELRELHFGIGNRPTHRIVFTILDDRVYVLTVRHSGQDDLRSDDFQSLSSDL